MNHLSRERSELHGVIQSLSVQATAQHVQSTKRKAFPASLFGLLDNFSLVFVFIARLTTVQIIIFKNFTDIE